MWKGRFVVECVFFDVRGSGVSVRSMACVIVENPLNLDCCPRKVLGTVDMRGNDVYIRSIYQVIKIGIHLSLHGEFDILL